MDLNISTCNPDTNSSQLTISLALDVLVHVTWIRLYTDIDMSDYNLQVGLQNERCMDTRIYRVSDTILDVSCNSTGVTNKLVLSGPVAGHICDLRLSAGRNLALRQKTQQSSTLVNHESSKAVDGLLENNHASNSCAATDKVHGQPWWTLEFPYPSRLHEMYILTSDDCEIEACSLKLELLASSNAPPHYTYLHQDIGSFISVPLKNTHQTTLIVKISMPENPESDGNVMNLCEVSVSGEYVCPTGRYGLSCEKTCECGVTESCSPWSGLCAAPCVKDQPDQNCSYRCHPNCLSSRCQKGDCVSCVASECLSCSPGFLGTYCDERKAVECPQGKFGKNCTYDCPSGCLHSKCNSTTGECFSCEGHRVMPFCKGDDQTGESKSEDASSWLWFLPFLLMPLVVFFLCFIKQRTALQAPEEENIVLYDDAHIRA